MNGEQHGCYEKTAFGTWAAAVHSAKEVNRANRDRNDTKHVHVYRCPTCGGVHVGRESTRRSKRT